MMLRAIVMLVVAGAVGALGAGCGGGESSKTPTAAAPTTAAVSPTRAASPTPPGPTPTPCPTSTASTTPVTGAAPAGFPTTLENVSIESQPCFDRMTFTFSGGIPSGYDVRYVQNASGCATGDPVSTVGEAQLQVKLQPANAHNDAGQPTIDDRTISVLYPAIKEAVLTCDFEADVTWVLGTNEGPFTVTASGTTIVVDVYH